MLDLGGLISTMTATVGASLILCTLFELIQILDLARNWRRTASGTPTPLSPTPAVRRFVSLHVPVC